MTKKKKKATHNLVLLKIKFSQAPLRCFRTSNRQQCTFKEELQFTSAPGVPMCDHCHLGRNEHLLHSGPWSSWRFSSSGGARVQGASPEGGGPHMSADTRQKPSAPRPFGSAAWARSQGIWNSPDGRGVQCVELKSTMCLRARK